MAEASATIYKAAVFMWSHGLLIYRSNSEDKPIVSNLKHVKQGSVTSQGNIWGPWMNED